MRSNCTVSYALDFIGDKWTLLIIRDMIFDKKRFYKDFLSSQERIATNILSDRLKKLEQNGIIESEIFKEKRTQKVYSLTQKGKDLIPIILEMMLWSYRHKNDLNIPKEFANKIAEQRDQVVENLNKSLL